MPGYTTVSKSTCVRHTHSSAEAAEMTTLQEISYFYLKDTMQLGQSQLSSPLSQIKWWPFLGGCCVQETKVFFLLSAKMCFLGCHNNTTLHVSWIIQTIYGQVASLNILWGVLVKIFVVPLQLKNRNHNQALGMCNTRVGFKVRHWSAGLLVPWEGPWTVWIFFRILSFCP